MTNALQVGLSIAGPLSGQGLSVGAADAAALNGASTGSVEETFAALIEHVSSQITGESVRAGSSAPIMLPHTGLPVSETAGETELALGDMLSQLLGKLTEFEEALDGDTPPDADALDEIADVLTGIEQLLATTELPMPGGAAFEKLNALATSLGLDVGGKSGHPFDTLASLAAEVAQKTVTIAPEVAAKLDDFASLMDRHAVHMQSVAAQDAEMPAATQKVILLSNVQSTPAKDIEQAVSTAGHIATGASEAAEKPAIGETPPDTPRTLAKQEGNTQPDAAKRPPNAADTKAAAQAAVQSASVNDAVTGIKDGDTAILPTGHQGASAGQAAANARAGQSTQAFAPQTAPVDMQYVAAEITRQVQNGVNRFEIRLNPPELGRIDVRMEMDQSGNVIARLAVEKSETLDLMQRDQRTLERALADAGLDSAKTELEFSLRQDGGGDDKDTADEAPWHTAQPDQPDDASAPQAAPGARTELYRSYVRPDGVNLWA